MHHYYLIATENYWRYSLGERSRQSCVSPGKKSIDFFPKEKKGWFRHTLYLIVSMEVPGNDRYVFWHRS